MKSYIFLLLLFPLGLFAQNISGTYEGQYSHNQLKGTCVIKLSQSHNKLSGTITSTENGIPFELPIRGLFDGSHVVLKELGGVNNSEYCLKRMRLKYINRDGEISLTGNWSSEACRQDGSMSVKGIKVNPSPKPKTLTKIAGTWTGRLTQDDKNFGYYFELFIGGEKTGGTGSSYIISEGMGGSAYHEMDWQYDPQTQTLAFTESDILYQSKYSDYWRWCMKQATLKISQTDSIWRLEGAWEGGYMDDWSGEYIECSPGMIYLEKAVEKKALKVSEESKSFEHYEEEEKREVKISKTFEIEQETDTLTLKLWDSELEDGDLVSLYWNDEVLVERVKVLKKPQEFKLPVTQEENFLIMHAINMGGTPPNTAAVHISDPKNQYKTILSSDQEESSCVLVKKK